MGLRIFTKTSQSERIFNFFPLKQEARFNLYELNTCVLRCQYLFLSNVTNLLKSK